VLLRVLTWDAILNSWSACTNKDIPRKEMNIAQFQSDLTASVNKLFHNVNN